MGELEDLLGQLSTEVPNEDNPEVNEPTGEGDDDEEEDDEDSSGTNNPPAAITDKETRIIMAKPAALSNNDVQKFLNFFR